MKTILEDSFFFLNTENTIFVFSKNFSCYLNLVVSMFFITKGIYEPNVLSMFSLFFLFFRTKQFLKIGTKQAQNSNHFPFFFLLLQNSTLYVVCFLDAGASPKAILEMMNIPDLKQGHISSHLQVHFCSLPFSLHCLRNSPTFLANTIKHLNIYYLTSDEAKLFAILLSV